MSTKNAPSISRREALMTTLTVAGAAIGAQIFAKSATAAEPVKTAAPAAAKSAVDTKAAAAIPNAATETDGLGKALGYCTDADKAIACAPRKQTTRKGQYCKNCQFYTLTKGQEFGPCQLLANKNVAAKGWCNSYIKDPKKS